MLSAVLNIFVILKQVKAAANEESKIQTQIIMQNESPNSKSNNNIYANKVFTVDNNYDTTFKAYMDYRKITDVTSAQWGLQQKAYTDNNGLRKIDDYYCVALGTFYSEKCGEKFKISLDSGITFNAIVADIKHPDDTDKYNKFTPLIDNNNDPICNGNGITMVNVVEFIVDENIISDYVRYTKGCVSPIGFEGNVTTMEKIGK